MTTTPATYVAMLLLRGPVDLAPTAIEAELRRIGLAAQVTIRPDLNANAMMVTVGASTAVIMLLDVPLPVGTLDRAIDHSSWTSAQEILAPHRAHMIVSSFGESQDIAGRVEAARMVTKVCAAAVAVTSTLGVYFAAPEAVYEPRFFVAQAASLVTGDVPTGLWVRLHFYRGPKEGDRPTLGCMTTGLYDLVDREIEFVAAPLTRAEMGHLVLGGAYLLTHGSTFKDGDTMGGEGGGRTFESPSLTEARFHPVRSTG